MNDPDVLTAVKASYAGIHMDVPLDVIVRRGRRLRARRRLPGLAVAAATVAALALAVAALIPGSGRATAPGGSTGTERLAAWTVVSQRGGSVKVILRGAHIRDVAGLQDKLRSDGIPARVAHIGHLRPPLSIPMNPITRSGVFVRGVSEAAQRPTVAGLVPGCSPPPGPGRSVPSAGGHGLKRYWLCSPSRSWMAIGSSQLGHRPPMPTVDMNVLQSGQCWLPRARRPHSPHS